MPLLPGCLEPGHTPGWRTAAGTSVLELDEGQVIGKPQHCSLSSDFAELIQIGDQVRVQRTDSEYALYTVVELRDEAEAGIVRMAMEGRQRLGTSDSFAATLTTTLAASELDDDEAKAQSELVERLGDDGLHDELLVAAPHGGKVEAYTDLQAERIASSLAGISSWICKGWRNPSGAFQRWHITSTELSPNSFPGLAEIADRGFGHVVSFHGMSGSGVLIGGRAPMELREQLRGAIMDAIADPSVAVSVSGDDGPLAGVSPHNFVNWLSAGGEAGIQIEQSWVARSQYWAVIADAVSGVLG